MRTTFLLLAIFVATSRLGAAELITVTPQHLEGWMLTNGDKSALAGDPHVVLPAGSQLSRVFAPATVVVRLKTAPRFSETPCEWPVLELSSVAVALVRRGGEDRLVVTSGEKICADLPLAADTDGAIDFTLGYDPHAGAGLLICGSQKQSFDADLRGAPVPVVLSSGRSYPWPQQSLQVLVLSDEPVLSQVGSSFGETKRSGTGAPSDSVLARLLADASAFVPKGSGSAGGQPGAAVAAPMRQLEVITPSAYRRSRANTVRAAVAQAQSK